MSMTAEHVAQEDLMALADGELVGAELSEAEAHVASCAACSAALAQARLPLQSWSVETTPAAIDAAVLGRLNEWARSNAKPVLSTSRWVWGLSAAAGAMALVVMTVALGDTALPGMKTRLSTFAKPHSGKRAEAELLGPGGGLGQAPDESLGTLESKVRAQPVQPPKVLVTDGLAMPSRAQQAPAMAGLGRTQAAAVLQPEAAPMIARTVALAMMVKDVDRARESLDGLLHVYNGYSAQMELQTPEGGVRRLHASLRVPSGQMRGLLAELKGYGRVDSETQTGEEVGQQHADLIARLAVARESETRLRAILKTRPGDVADVLQVEEEISRVRGEIEGMEAEQQGLEHRVTYATIDLDLYEHDPAPPPTASAWSRLAEAARAGGRNAATAVVGLVAFLLEYGLAFVLIAALLLVPAWFLWRRWRKASARW